MLYVMLCLNQPLIYLHYLPKNITTLKIYFITKVQLKHILLNKYQKKILVIFLLSLMCVLLVVLASILLTLSLDAFYVLLL